MGHDVTAHTMCKYGEWSLFIVLSRLNPCFNLENEKVYAVLGVLTPKIRPSRRSKTKTIYCSDFKKIRKFFKESKVRCRCGCVTADKQKPSFSFFGVCFELKFAPWRMLLFDLNCMNVKLWGILSWNVVLLAEINLDIFDYIVIDFDSPMLYAIYFIFSK